MKKSELKAIIRECIEESFLVDEIEALDEKTPNQRKYQRPPVGQTAGGKPSSSYVRARVNTVRGGDAISSHQPVYHDEYGGKETVRSGPRKGKLTKDEIKYKKDTIKKVRDARGPKARKDYDPDEWNDREYVFPKRGSYKQKTLKQSSYKKSGIGRKGR